MTEPGSLRASYLSIDRRLLGLFRIYLGVVLLGDLGRRLPELALFYSDEGVLPSHLSLFAPLASPNFSLLHAFTSPGEVAFAFVLFACVYLALVAGFHTKLAQILALLVWTSLGARNLFLENSGNAAMAALLVWTTFLPLGDRYSVDAWRKARRGEPEGEAAFTSLAVLALALQIAAIYLLNAVQKSGATWRAGEAVHDVLWQHRLTTSAAGLLRLHEPAWLSPALSWFTLVIEWSAPLLVLSPLRTGATRTLHFVLTTALHLGIALLFSVGVFSWAMIGFNLLLLPPTAIDALLRRVPFFARLSRSSAASSLPPPSPLPFFEHVHRWGRALRETAVLLVLVTIGAQITQDNAVVPTWLRVPPPFPTPVRYLRLIQGWNQFAPEAPRHDGTFVVDARTESGRHIDPLTGAPPDFDVLMRGPGAMSQLRCEYFYHVRREPFARYRDALARWLLDWHRREGLAASERIVALDVWWVSADAPPPGETTPRNLRKTQILHHP
ncbi:HTTM domain-containing protein [Polyangium fumosum]|uniref:HTTM-like domain-containing protein n=1 Tax=Polyangium fumosum TaxID=889272 RepID=A0A4U1JL97_9BACT|nr:HTTM domain-containing protein [Polyangium fumosum]TKD12865.1 hypothetical protein E8A74_03715 [Polyangium fumosum]